MKCAKHPRYKAQRKPEVACFWCWALWAARLLGYKVPLDSKRAAARRKPPAVTDSPEG